MIRAEEVAVRFGAVEALSPTSLEIAQDDRIGIVGRNGSGKSTLLRVLAGLAEPSAGRVVGMLPHGDVVLVHQRPYLFRGTALDNVRIGGRLGNLRREGALALLHSLGIEYVATRDVRALSGGERRRVAIARALARRPSVLLLDEPDADLDSAAREAVASIIAAFSGAVVVASPDPHPIGTRREIVLTRSTAAAPR